MLTNQLTSLNVYFTTVCTAFPVVEYTWQKSHVGKCYQEALEDSWL
jgi:hypothetical protein